MLLEQVNLRHLPHTHPTATTDLSPLFHHADSLCLLYDEHSHFCFQANKQNLKNINKTRINEGPPPPAPHRDIEIFHCFCIQCDLKCMLCLFHDDTIFIILIIWVCMFLPRREGRFHAKTEKSINQFLIESHCFEVRNLHVNWSGCVGRMIKNKALIYNSCIFPIRKVMRNERVFLFFTQREKEKKNWPSDATMNLTFISFCVRQLLLSSSVF